MINFNTMQQLINGNILDIDLDTFSLDNKEDSKFLYQKLCFYFEGFERLNHSSNKRYFL